ncbi:hypothetical protein LTR94_033622, partial [Friedmanniomyces endolithicus]
RLRAAQRAVLSARQDAQCRNRRAQRAVRQAVAADRVDLSHRLEGDPGSQPDGQRCGRHHRQRQRGAVAGLRRVGSAARHAAADAARHLRLCRCQADEGCARHPGQPGSDVRRLCGGSLARFGEAYRQR